MAAKTLLIYRILVDLVGSKLCQLISESYSSQDRNTMYIVYVHSGILGNFRNFVDFRRNLGENRLLPYFRIFLGIQEWQRQPSTMYQVRNSRFISSSSIMLVKISLLWYVTWRVFLFVVIFLVTLFLPTQLLFGLQIDIRLFL